MKYTEEQKCAIKKFEQKMNKQYLTEELLGEFLTIAYPNYVWEHDKRFQIVGGQDYKFKPDYCCHELKMCVEFDGADHYMKANVIECDRRKDEVLKELGYKVIRVPYFVQLDSASIKYLFNLDLRLDYNFKHGFINKNAILPSSYCEQGTWKFKDFITSLEIDKFNNGQIIYHQIRESLLNKIEISKLSEEEAILSVIPSTLISPLKIRERNYNSLDNQNKVHSNLENNWNVVILESSLSMKEQSGVYNLEYTFNSEGNISGYSFKMLINGEVSTHTLLVTKEIDDENEINADIQVFMNDKLFFHEYTYARNINIFNLSAMLF